MPKGYVLVADDDNDLREAIALVLKRAGRCVRRAANGADALRFAREQVPAAVFLDLTMPVWDGLVFLEARRAAPALARVPVVLMSGDHAAAEAVAAEFAGVQVLGKPFRAAELRAVLERVVPTGPPAGGG